MKKSFNILMILCAFSILASCDDSKTYADMLKDERKEIKAFLEDQNIKVLDEYPSDSIFKDNEFVLLENGVYFNVINRGNANRAVAGETKILCRFKVRGLRDTSVVNINGLNNPYIPTKFIFGYNTAIPDKYYANILDDFVSNGLASGLQYVGDSSYVKMIVPFKVSSSYFSQQGTPLYFGRVRYLFDK